MINDIQPLRAKSIFDILLPTIALLFVMLFMNSCGMKKPPITTVPPERTVPLALQSWHQLIIDTQNATDAIKLLSVNAYFNKFQYVDDIDLWGMEDYWATPIEMIEKGAGDCEDFAIAKYFTLRLMGVEEEKLRITYVIALNRKNMPHMVLEYYRSPFSPALVLDSLEKTIVPNTQRTDLLPAYSFNADNLWLADKTRSEKIRSAAGLSLWQEVLHRYHLELANLPF